MKHQVVDRLLLLAMHNGGLFDSMIGCEDWKNKTGRYAPGALINRLSDKEREVVKTLTKKDFYHRIKK